MEESVQRGQEDPYVSNYRGTTNDSEGLDSRPTGPATRLVQQTAPARASAPQLVPDAPLSRLSPLCRQYVGIGMGVYDKLSRFISDNPDIVSPGDIDDLMAQALEEEKAGHITMSQTCIHQALLLRKCKDLEPKRRRAFFMKMTDRNGDTVKAVVQDMRKVYAKVQKAAQESQSSSPHPRAGLPVVTKAEDPPRKSDVFRSAQPTYEEGPSPSYIVRDTSGRKTYYGDCGRGSGKATSSYRQDNSQTKSDSADLVRSVADMKIRAPLGNEVRAENPINVLVKRSHDQAYQFPVKDGFLPI